MKRANLFLFLFCLFLAVPSQAKTIYVDTNAPGPTHDGSSWANAYNYLQDALADADSPHKPVEIRVARGTYRPDEDTLHPNGTGDREATFQLIDDVTIKGGYAGSGHPDPNARNIELYETILSGDLNDNDTDVNNPQELLDNPNRSDNSYHVVTGSGTDANAVLQGFTATGGNADALSPWMDGCGGGMFNDNDSSPRLFNCKFIDNSAYLGGGMCNLSKSSPIVTNCTFSRNSAGRGGGMFNRTSSPMVTNCTFSGNSAREHGGGLQNDANSSPILNNCSFSDNTTALGCGGGIQNHESNPTLINCNFTANSIKQGGGGIHNYMCSPILINCAFNGNSAEHGGGVFNAGGDPILTNCTFSGNLVRRNGGGICGGNSSPTLTNCILWGDIPEEIYVFSGTPMLNYCDVQGGWPGEGNIDADPCFAMPGYWDPNVTPEDANDDFWVDGDYHLKSQASRWDANEGRWTKDEVTSPCIDAGNPGCPLGDEPNDVNNIRINMGAFGGTAEASKSPANWRSIADITNDWVVDSNDLKVFINYWLNTGECIPSDLDHSQFVDFADYGIFALQWSDPSASQPSMTYQIDDCNQEASGLFAAEQSSQPRFSVWVEGRYIHFEDLMYANCCPDELGLDKEINGNQITLYEIGYGGLCDCMCYFPITATLGPFEDGTYTVEVYDNYGQSLGVVEVTIGETTGPGIEYQIFPCNRELFAAEQSGQTRFSVTVEGRYIHFEDMMVANCCPDELELEMTVEDNLITIYETEYTPGGCFCICDYPVTATLGPFEPGTYVLEVYEDWGHFIGSTTVVIAPPE